ncbi:MAG: carbon-nitrogen hydrolase family protein, partial [Chromatiales bacterium]
DAVMRRFPWLEMIVCPELASCGTNFKAAEAMPGARENRFQEVAKRHQIWLLPGSMLEADGDRIYNTAPVISPEGTVVTRHRKLFPWCPYENGVTPGDQHTVFDVPGVARFGVSICYDMWYPETVRALVWQGAEVILHPNLTSSIDRDAEKAMIRAHAAQNQCYFFDVNMADSMGVGESLIAGPGGEVIYQAGKGREIIPLKLDLDYLRDVRRHGWQNLGQPLKSFRDSQLTFPQYEKGHDSEALRALGELRMPIRGEGR